MLAIVLAYTLFAQGTLTKLSTFNRPVKILGQPAASEWIEVQPNIIGQAATTLTPGARVDHTTC